MPATCFLIWWAVPGWALPLSAVPAYALLVALIEFSQCADSKNRRSWLAEVAAGSAKSVLLALGFVYIAEHDEIAPAALPVTFLSTWTALLLWRGWIREARSANLIRRNVLIAGAGPAGRAAARALRSDPEYQANVCGFVDDDSPRSQEILGGIDDLPWLARSEFIDEVILAMPNRPARARQAAEVARRIRLDVRAVLDLPADPWPGIALIAGMPLITLHREAVPRLSLFLKRLLDIAGAVAGLTLLSPLLGIVTLLIRLDSPGPAIYSAERIGAKGRRFRCYKFRSMVDGAERLKDSLRSRNWREGPIFKLADDPRITRVGRILRRYSLDELPQLWNVLRGDMSLVGPRPHPVDEVSHYKLQDYRRLDVKPGLTGLWQVTARNNPSFELNMRLDLSYIENWNLLLDFRILLRSVRVLFVAEGT